MSVFTKRRKALRIKQEEDRKRWDESSKRMKESMDAMVEVMKIISSKYPEYESITDEERAVIYTKEYKQYCQDHNIDY